MMMKVSNNYTRAISAELYDAIPKAVWAALAISFSQMVQDENWDRTHIEGFLLSEWQVLFEQEIVPQKPPQALMKKRGGWEKKVGRDL